MPEFLWWILGGIGAVVLVWLVASLVISAVVAPKVLKFQKEVFNEVDKSFKEFNKDDFFKGF